MDLVVSIDRSDGTPTYRTAKSVDGYLITIGTDACILTYVEHRFGESTCT